MWNTAARDEGVCQTLYLRDFAGYDQLKPRVNGQTWREALLAVVTHPNIAGCRKSVADLLDAAVTLSINQLNGLPGLIRLCVLTRGARLYVLFCVVPFLFAQSICRARSLIRPEPTSILPAQRMEFEYAVLSVFLPTHVTRMCLWSALELYTRPVSTTASKPSQCASH